MTYMTPREWLQRQVNTHKDAETRRQAQAVLNVVGNNWGIDQRFLNQDRYNSSGVEHKRSGGSNPFNSGNYANYSNGYSAYEVNRLINPQMQKMYNADKAIWNKEQSLNRPNPKPENTVTGAGGSTMTYDPRAVAFLDQQIAKFPGLYQNINQQRQNKISAINEGYDKAEYDVNNDYALAKRNYEFDTQQRLKTRDKRLAGNDADYKNKTDSWQRYLNMLGVGRSGAADVVIPDLLSKEASYAKDQIEEENALNATKANNAWEETERKKTRTLSDLMSGRRRDTAEANESYDNLLSQQKDKEAELRNKRGQMQGRTLSSILGETNPIIQEAERLSTQATSHAKNLPQIKRDEIKYDAIEPDKFRLDRKESNINTTQPGQDDETIKNVEEEKKKKYMTLSSLVGA